MIADPGECLVKAESLETSFEIFLSLSQETATGDKKADAAAPVMGGNETVLVAEDETSLRKLIKTVLESSGYRVILAEDGQDAVTKFMENRERINLVMLDMIMPKKNGKEVCAVVRKMDPRMKVLFTSGYAMECAKKYYPDFNISEDNCHTIATPCLLCSHT